MYIYIHMYVYNVYNDIYIYTHTHTYIYIYIYIHPRGIEILVCCPAGSVFPHGEKVPLKPWLATLLVMV